ncbi:MAG: YihY/virulence factor BrkB family protein [Ignavibacteriales bacterium]|nr:YihY/virulence factor BrkB family protein [Ignavibacteriales bacterium]
MGKFKHKILRFISSILPIKLIRKTTDFTGHYFKGLYFRLDEHHAFLYAGGITFSIFTCIIPLILIAFSVLGFLLDDAQIEGQIIAFIHAFIPIHEYANYAKETILALTNEVIEY